jgi:hypothetical protein
MSSDTHMPGEAGNSYMSIRDVFYQVIMEEALL